MGDLRDIPGKRSQEAGDFKNVGSGMQSKHGTQDAVFPINPDFTLSSEDHWAFGQGPAQ